MAYRIEPFRRPVEVRPPGSSDLHMARDKRRPGPPMHDPGEWLVWSANGDTELVTVPRPAVLLDSFTRLSRPADPAIRRALLETFAREYGPWACCEARDVHADFDALGLRSVAQSREAVVARAERARQRQPMRPPRGAAVAPAVQWIPGMLLSAEKVNALRAIVAAVMQGRRADPRLWRLLWPAPYRRPFSLGSLDDEGHAAHFLTQAWLAAGHVELGPPIGGANAAARVGGVAGALAVALANEFDPRNRVARCTHRLRAGRCADLPVEGVDRSLPAARCGLTWLPGRRTKGGGLPARCPACDNLHRVTELRVSRRRARSIRSTTKPTK